MKIIKQRLKEYIEHSTIKILKEELDDSTLSELIDMEMESADLERGNVVITDELRQVVEQYEADLEKVLEWWVRKNPDRLISDIDGTPDPVSFVEVLMYDGDAPYNVLMTLRGEGVGIWDGRWDQYFGEPKDVAALASFLKKRLAGYADDTGGGRLNQAIQDAAYESTGSMEMESATFMEAGKAGKTEHSGSKKGKGAYWGPKQDAKKESNKKRRAQDKKESMKKEGWSQDRLRSGNFGRWSEGEHKYHISSPENVFDYLMNDILDPAVYSVQQMKAMAVNIVKHNKGKTLTADEMLRSWRKNKP